MPDRSCDPTRLAAWRALDAEREALSGVHMRDLFAGDPRRSERMTVEAAGLALDFSRNIATPDTIGLLADLAVAAGVETRRDAMFAGRHINVTEDRAVLHVALRSAPGDAFRDGEQDCTADVRRVLDEMAAFVDRVRSADYRGWTGRPVESVVNIGIGGSDLGIVMATAALARYRHERIRVFSVSNIDGTDLADVLAEVDPETTLFVICSKTFTTLETLTNARAARQWLIDRAGAAAVARHFVAVSTNHAAMDEFGIDPAHRFEFWDWVGGRYSLWSAVGLTVALAVGMAHFRELLDGARAMDRHFLSAPPTANLPIILGGLAVWYNNFLGASTQAVLPYDNRLARLPAYLQQLHMESNGKGVRLDGMSVATDTGTIIWGEPGSNAQHSFYQLLHQGTRLVPVDFLAPINGSGPDQRQHDLALANCFAQAQALVDGQSLAEVQAELGARGLGTEDIERLAPHKVHPGNRPSNLILFPRLDPAALGAIVALYEHKVFVEGTIWGINSFDQWGVELGKRRAGELASAVTDPAAARGLDPATRRLLSYVERWRDPA
jgi:glucose-6-phosphate isomerase